MEPFRQVLVNRIPKSADALSLLGKKRAPTHTTYPPRVVINALDLCKRQLKLSMVTYKVMYR
jgi:hypothetical protein